MSKYSCSKLSKLTHVLLFISMVFMWVSPTYAQSQVVSDLDHTPSSQDRFQENLENKQTYEEAIIYIEQYLIVGEDGLFHLTIDAKQVSIDRDLFEFLRSQVQETNKLIQDGELALEDIMLISTGRNIFGDHLALNNYSNSMASSCAGWTGTIYTVVGPSYYFNECQTQAIQGMLWAGTGATGICAAIAGYLGVAPVALVCALAAGLGAIGAGAIQAIDGLGGNQGVFFQMSWSGDLLYIWHQ